MGCRPAEVRTFAVPVQTGSEKAICVAVASPWIDLSVRISVFGTAGKAVYLALEQQDLALANSVIANTAGTYKIAAAVQDTLLIKRGQRLWAMADDASITICVNTTDVALEETGGDGAYATTNRR